MVGLLENRVTFQKGKYTNSPGMFAVFFVKVDICGIHIGNWVVVGSCKDCKLNLQ